jgi:hypothetical protein
MPRVGFEPTNPMFERGKTVDALDGAVTVIGTTYYTVLKFILIWLSWNHDPEM